MTDVRKVWPKEALTAERQERSETLSAGWHVYFPPAQRTVFVSDCRDRPFAAAFVDAALLTELVDAARAWNEQHVMCHDPKTYLWAKRELARRAFRLRAALAAFDAAMRPDGETPA